MKERIHEQLLSKKDRAEPSDDENSTMLASGGDANVNENSEELLCGISKDLHDINNGISELKSDLRRDLKEELDTLKHKLNQKLTEVGAALQEQGQAITEAEQRIMDIEVSGIVTREALLCMLKEQRRLRDKVIDLESRSRRNNIRLVFPRTLKAT